MNKNYNILIVGAGKIGSIRAQTAKKLYPKSKLYVFDTDSIKAMDLAKEMSGIHIKTLEEGLLNKEIQIVVVSVINKFTKDICIKAIKSGKHVLCEKPMGINYTEAQAIYKAAKKYKRIVKCGFNHRYHPGIKEAHKLCKQKIIGDVLFIRATYGHGGRAGYDKEWRSKKALSGGGELLDQGSHLIDLCHWFLNFEEMKKTYCIAKTMFWDMEVDDNAFALLETKTGKVAQLHATWTQWKNKFKFEIYGTKGAIEVDGLGKSYGDETVRIFKRYKLGAAPKIIEKVFKGNDISWEHEWKDFINGIKSNKLPMSNYKESLEVMKTISSLYSH